MKINMFKELMELRGIFKGKPYKVFKNKDGFYKIQVNEGYWRDVTYNDTAWAIVGKGNPDAELFTTREEVDEFIEEHWHREPARYDDDTPLSTINQEWEEQ